MRWRAAALQIPDGPYTDTCQKCAALELMELLCEAVGEQNGSAAMREEKARHVEKRARFVAAEIAAGRT